MTGRDANIRPASAAADAARRPDRVRDWIAVGRPEALAGLTLPPGQGRLSGRALPLIGGLTLRCSYRQALDLARLEGVALLWAYDRDLYGQVVGAIAGLGYALRNGARVASLSMGPPKAVAQLMRPDPQEPLTLATRAAVRAGMVVVVAIGNYGPEEGVVNPWCADWTINVGASDTEGTALAPFSARGLPGATDGPTLVAPGLDVVTTHPPGLPKTPQQLARESAAPVFFDPTPPALRAHRTVVSGTSFATPQVAAMAARIAWCFDTQYQRMQDGAGPDFLALPVAAPPGLGAQRPRLAGIAPDRLFPGHAVYRLASFHGAMRAATVKQVLIDLARPVPGRLPHEVGAGFVSPAIIEAALAGFAPPPPRIMAVKAFNA